MIDGERLAKYLDDTGLMMEEFYVLYRLMYMEENVKNGIMKLPSKEEGDISKLYAQWSQNYQDKHKTYLGLNIDYPTVCRKLAEEGYLEIWSKDPDTEIKLTEMRTTEKFKKQFLISDIERVFNEVLEIYPMWIFVNGTKYPAVDKSPTDLAKLYAEHVVIGRNALLHERFILITSKYIEQENSKYAKYKLSNWIREAFHGVAYAMENDSEYDGVKFGTDAN